MECPICLNSFENDSRLFNKKIINSPCCNQNIHEKCLKRWLRDNTTCPLCREILQYVPVANGINYFTKQTIIRITLFMVSLVSFILITILSEDYRLFSVLSFIIMLVIISIFIINMICHPGCNCENCMLYETSYRRRYVLIHNPAEESLEAL